MLNELQIWFSEEYLEAIATILGIINIYFGIKEKSLFWVFAIIGSMLYFFVYAEAKIYAFMILQLYYIGIGFYGLYYWIKGSKNEKKILVSHLRKNKIPIYIGVFLVLYIIISIVLIKFTDSEIAYIDAFISSGSIIAIYAMMKKYIETWIIWVTLDIVTITTFIDQKLYATVVLFVLYLIFAIVGYYEWKKSILKNLKIKK